MNHIPPDRAGAHCSDWPTDGTWLEKATTQSSRFFSSESPIYVFRMTDSSSSSFMGKRKSALKPIIRKGSLFILRKLYGRLSPRRIPAREKAKPSFWSQFPSALGGVLTKIIVLLTQHFQIQVSFLLRQLVLTSAIYFVPAAIASTFSLLLQHQSWSIKHNRGVLKGKLIKDLETFL